MEMIKTFKLQDPQKLMVNDHARLVALDKKLTTALTRLCKRPENGGNPFLFSLLLPKKQILCDKLSGKPFKTAFTNGRVIGWNPDFLESLNPEEVVNVMCHEIYHVLFMHGTRMKGKKRHIANIAMDYSVNNEIEYDNNKRAKPLELWGVQGLGRAFSLKEYTDWIDATGADESPWPVTFVDPSIRDKFPEEIYNIIMEHCANSPRRCKSEDDGCGALSLDPKTGVSIIPKPWAEVSCPKCGAEPDGDSHGGGGRSMDEHVEGDLSKEEIFMDLLKASNSAKSMYGTTPDNIEALLKTLLKPQLRARDIIRNARLRYQQDQGDLNDYKRLRRRGLSNNPQLFQWKKKDYASEWVAMIDTSGSMSDDDIANGIKELQLVSVDGKGWIVPCDTKPHWKSKIEINGQSDILRTKIIGRGGTVFDEFFRDLPKNFPDGYDTVVIITDGDCGQIPRELRPKCDVVWLITNEREFRPSFGRVCHLTAR